MRQESYDIAALPEAQVVDDSAAAVTVTDSRSWEVVFVLGGPGCGKGTQCERISKRFGFTHLSTGDLMRAELQRGSPLAKEIKSYMDKGALVPTEIVLRLLKEAMMVRAGRSRQRLVSFKATLQHLLYDVSELAVAYVPSSSAEAHQRSAPNSPLTCRPGLTLT